MAAVALGVASLVMGAAGAVSSAQGQATGARAQYEQQRINQQWSEFEKQLALSQQRGTMGLQEFDRLFGNAVLERESLEQQILGQRAYREQSQYQTQQLVRNFRETMARQSGSLASRGVGRGGSAEAIQRQTEKNMLNDHARLRINDEYQLAAFQNQRNEILKKRNLRPTNQPPTYIPATPVQMPNTSGMVAGALLGAVAQGLGGIGGAMAARQSPGSTPGSGGQMGPPAPSYVYPVDGVGPPQQIFN